MSTKRKMVNRLYCNVTNKMNLTKGVESNNYDVT